MGYAKHYRVEHGRNEFVNDKSHIKERCAVAARHWRRLEDGKNLTGKIHSLYLI